MRVVLSLIMLLGMFSPALGQQIVVRSGEHDTFSRLVIRFPSTLPGWVLGRTEGGYLLRLADADQGFDISRAFERIPRTRINDITTDAAHSELFIASTCDCHIVGFELPDGQLVLDLKSGAQPAESPFEQVLSRGGVETAVVEAEEETAPNTAPGSTLGFTIAEPAATLSPDFPNPYARSDTRQRTPAPAVDLPVLAHERTRSIYLPELTVDVTPEAEARSSEPISTTDMSDRASEIRSRALRDISRGIAEGMLTETRTLDDIKEDMVAADHDQNQVVAEPESNPDNAPDATPEQATETSDVLPDQSRVRITTGFERGQEFRPPLPDETLDCTVGERLEIARWGHGMTPIEAITVAHADLYQEFDAINEAGANKLVRAYIHAGFGAEARAIMGLAPDSIQDADALETLSYLVEGRAPAQVGQLGGLQRCDNIAALWAILADGEIANPTEINQQLIAAKAAALPEHLRSQLIPEIVSWFEAQQNTNAAELLRNTMERAQQTDVAALQLIDAVTSGELSRLAQSDAEIAPDALTRLFELAAVDKTYLDDHYFVLARAYMHEHQQSRTSLDLFKAMLSAMPHSGKLDDAMVALSSHEYADQIDRTERDALWKSLAQVLIDEPKDAAFAMTAYRHLDRLRQADLPRQERQALARRLASFGLRLGSESLVDIGQNPSLTDRLTLAEISLHLTDPARAMQLIGGADTPEARALKARALEDMSQFAEAAMNFAEPQRRQRNLWRAGDWAALGELTDDDMIDWAITTMVTEPDPVDPSFAYDGQALTRAQTLIDDSQHSREIADQLLSEHALANFQNE